MGQGAAEGTRMRDSKGPRDALSNTAVGVSQSTHRWRTR